MRTPHKRAVGFFKEAFSSALIAPIIFIFIYGGIFFLIRGSAPTPHELTEHFASLYSRYGYEIIFFGSMLEGLVLINFVVPGATAVILGAIFARTGQVDLNLVILAASCGAIVGYTMDYFLGRFGFGKIIDRFGFSSALNRAKVQIDRSAIKTFSLGFIHPNLGSLTALAAGTLKMAFKKFFPKMAVITFAWFTIWGISIFILGEIFLELISRYFFVVIFLTLIFWMGSLLVDSKKR